jgi:hypothetical protein
MLYHSLAPDITMTKVIHLPHATTPPTLPESYEHGDGLRFAQARVLKTLGVKYNVDNWVEASGFFRESGQLITNLCKASMEQDTRTCSDLIAQIAETEEQAYLLLGDRVQ